MAELENIPDAYAAAIKNGNPICANCSALVKTKEGESGLDEGSDSKDANLPCGCKYCWHCSDNRGRHEDHDPDCKGPSQ